MAERAWPEQWEMDGMELPTLSVKFREGVSKSVSPLPHQERLDVLMTTSHECKRKEVTPEKEGKIDSSLLKY